MAVIDSYLKQVIEHNGSDLHFLAGDPARVRQYGELKALSPEPLTPDMVKSALYEIMPKLSVERFEAKDGTDFAYSIPGLARFRVNILRQLNGMGGVFRVIPSKAKSAEDLKLPDSVMNLCKMNNGSSWSRGRPAPASRPPWRRWWMTSTPEKKVISSPSRIRSSSCTPARTA